MLEGIQREINIRIQALNAAKTVQEFNRLSDSADEYRRSLEGVADATEALNRLQKTQAAGVRGWKDGTRQAKADAQAKREATKATQDHERALKAEARAQTTANTAIKTTTGSLPRLRYALYDVSTTATIAGVAMLALAAATVGTAIKMDREFADVVRTTGTYLDTTGQQTAALRDEFNDLFTSLPASWSDLTDIGTLAGQLGVAKEDVAEFTSLVAKFSTVTGVSVEDSATAFGRLSELLNVSASEYENLGSSILATGVSSVATESQIIGISSQIASMGDYAGFSADQVVGLSSSLASLGVQPELSRGVVTRLFTNISVAIANGGDRLEAFGRLTNQSGADFKKAWGEDAAGALQEFLAGLGQVDATGGNSIATLKELGITASRDVPTLLKLAQNTELVAEQFDIAAQGFADGTAIQDQYGVVAETVASKLNVLKNNLTAMASSAAGSTGPLSLVVDVLTKMVSALTDILNNPLGQYMATTTVAVVAAAGAVALLAGGAARGAASMLAMRTALIETGGAAYTAKTGMDAATASTWRLAASIKGVKYAIASTGIGLALVAIGTAAAYLWEQFDKGKVSNQALVDSFSSALETDTLNGDGIRTLAETLGTYDESAQNVTLTQQAWNRILAGASTYVEEMARAVREARGEVDELNLSIGEATISEFLKTFTDDADLREAYQNGLIPTDLDFRVLAEAWAKGGDQAAFAYLDSLYKPEELRAAIERQKTLVQDAESEFSRLSVGLSASDAQELPAYENYWKQAEALAVLEQRLSSYNSVLGIMDDNTSAFAKAVQESAFGQRVMGDATKDSGDKAAQTADDFEAIADAIQATVDSYTEAQSQMLNTESALASLGSGLRDGGLDWSQYTDAGRENLGNLLSVMDAIAAETPGDASSIASNFQALYDTLLRGGYATTEQLLILQNTIQGLKNEGAAVTKTGKDFTSFFNGWAGGADKARKSTAAAREEVVTLLDYVGTLSKVLGNTFDFSFGFSKAFDDGITAVRDIEDRFAAAEEKVADLRQELNETASTITGLKANRATLEYFLSVAVQYGDTLRQNELVAELAENQSDLEGAEKDRIKTQKSLELAQQNTNRGLTGNSASAIQNRRDLEKLVETYQKQIEAYAATGASQQEIAAYSQTLRDQFTKEATQLGFNREELGKYIEVFNQFTTVIQAVPRNLTTTFTVEMSAAQKALAEYSAQLKDIRDAVAGGDYTPNFEDVSPVQIKFQMPSYDQFMAMQEYIRTATGDKKFRIAIPGGQGGQVFADGGYTGAGGKYEPAGIVHRGEYVIPKHGVDQRTGLPKQDYVGNLSRSVSNTPSYAGGGYVNGMGYNGSVTLSAGSIQQLARVLQSKIVVDGQTVADVVNRNNRQTTQSGRY